MLGIRAIAQRLSPVLAQRGLPAAAIARRFLSVAPKTYKIAELPGDGVGKEVMQCAKMVLDEVGFKAKYTHGDVGWEFWRTEGEPLPQRTIDLLEKSDAALFGAITSKPATDAAKELIPELKDQGLTYFSPIVRMRQLFDLYTCLRPCKAYPGNPLNYRDDIDVTIFRENTEGMYGGVEFYPVPSEVSEVLLKHSPKMKRFSAVPLENMAISTRIMTKEGCTRIIRAAFKYAEKFNKPSVTVCDKPNVLRMTGGLMRETAREVAEEFSNIPLYETNIDAQCMWLVKNPNDNPVLVAENMFGDILSDLAGQLVGGLGFACSANIGDKLGVFEPSHGSAPKYDGQNKVNPIAMILSAKMMLDWLGENTQASIIEQAVAAILKEGRLGTYDMKKDNPDTNLKVAEGIAAKAREIMSAGS